MTDLRKQIDDLRAHIVKVEEAERNAQRFSGARMDMLVSQNLVLMKQITALRKDNDRLRAVLLLLKAADGGIKCVVNHDALIDEALK